MSTATRLAGILTLLLLAAVGCRQKPAAAPSSSAASSSSSVVPSDSQLTSAVQAKLQGESALAGQNIQVASSNGVVTLSGSASDPASRALAGNDAGQVPGVKTVVNNLEVQPPQVASTKAPAPVPERRREDRSRRERADRHKIPPPPQPAPQPPAIAHNPPPPPPQPSAPPPPPQPVVRSFTFPAGTVLPVRVDDSLSSANAQVNQSFHATLAADLVRDGHVVIPQGTPVLGRITDAQDAAHFAGSALLSLELTRIDLPRNHLPIMTDTWAQRGKGRGSNTGKKAAGGAILGTLIGALAGGGKGAAIGAVAGAGAGTGINAATRGEQVQVAPETLINFTLQSPLAVTITLPPPGSPSPNEQPNPTLQQRPQPQPQ